MRSRLSQRLESETSKGIDLSPLLDVVFILLIFFIVTTVFVKETGIEVDKPKAVSSQQLQRNVILLAVSARGEVMYDGANIGISGVRGAIAQGISRQQRAVIIQADKDASAGLLVKVIDQAKLAGAGSVNLASEARGQQ